MEAHRERVSWPVWVHLVIAVAVLASLLGALPAGAGAWRLLPLGVAILLGYGWWRMRHLYVEAGPEGVAFGFGGPRRRVPRELIQAAREEAYSAARYMGWGYRIGWGRRDRAYSVIGCRTGIRLQFEDDSGRAWSVFLACRAPDAALTALGAIQ